MLVHGNSQALENKGWLPCEDSNHDVKGRCGICKLQISKWPEMDTMEMKTITRTQLAPGRIEICRRVLVAPKPKF